MFRIVFLLFGSLMLVRCSNQKHDAIALPYYNAPDFTPVFIHNRADITTAITHTLDDFSFLNQDSVTISQEVIDGKIHVANFIFTSCGSICPVMTRNMKIVSDHLMDVRDVVFLSFSVTPWIDTPHILRRYKRSNGIETKNWHFLTGSTGAIYRLARQSYFAEEDLGFSKDSTEFLHTEHFILVDRSKRIRGIYNGTLTWEMQQLIDDIQTLKKE